MERLEPSAADTLDLVSFPRVPKADLRPCRPRRGTGLTMPSAGTKIGATHRTGATA
jgi:hypothetical protein